MLSVGRGTLFVDKNETAILFNAWRPGAKCL